MSNGITFIELLTKAGPTVLSAGGVGAVIWLAVVVVPDERMQAMKEREEIRNSVILHINHMEDRHHAEVMKKLDELIALVNKNQNKP